MSDKLEFVALACFEQHDKLKFVGHFSYLNGEKVILILAQVNNISDVLALPGFPWRLESAAPVLTAIPVLA